MRPEDQLKYNEINAYISNMNAENEKFRKSLKCYLCGKSGNSNIYFRKV